MHQQAPVNEEKRCATCDEVENTKLPPCPNQCKQPKCKSYPEREVIDYFGKLFIWVYGAPSVGKTSIIQAVAPKFNLQRVHIGELLQKEVNSGSIRAQCIQNIISRGELVPNDTVLLLLHNEIDRLIKDCDGIIIDGYPRDKRQGVMFERIIGPVNAFIFLDGDKQQLAARHIERAANTNKRWPTDKRLDNCVAGNLQIRIFYENHNDVFNQYPHKISRIQTTNKSVQQVIEETTNVIATTVIKNQEAVKKALLEKARNTDCFVRRIYNKE